MYGGHEPLTEDLDSIRKRLESIEKELFAIKQGAWAGVVRYQQIMDKDAFADSGEREVFSNPEETSS